MRLLILIATIIAMLTTSIVVPKIDVVNMAIVVATTIGSYNIKK